MKKIYLFTCLIFLVISQMDGQEEASKGVKFGLHGGVNFSKYTARFTYTPFKFRSGYFLGAKVSITLSDRIKWQPELLFALQGSRWDHDELIYMSELGNRKTTISERTISMPLLFQYNMGQRFYLQAGPQIGYVLSQRYRVRETSFEAFKNEDNVTKQDFNRFDFGMTLGIGSHLSEKFDINFRYYRGLTGRCEAKSSVLNLGLGYWL